MTSALSLPDAVRNALAALASLSFTAWCLHRFRKPRPAKQETAVPAARTWIIYASQSGQAEDIARKTARALEAGGEAVALRRIDQPWLDELARPRRLLFVVSTYGEGDPPDHALRFARSVMTDDARPELRGLRYGVLALGDRGYPTFCAFGHRVDAWLRQAGAIPEPGLMVVDRMARDALQRWRDTVSEGAAGAAGELEDDPDFSEWYFIARECLNAGSPGAPMHRVVLQAPAATTQAWQAGDLVDLIVPGGDDRPRSYSIANLPEDGVVELIVRRHLYDGGKTGLASGWLTATAEEGDALQARIRPNPGFNLAVDLARPLLLIGAGAGIAGLRGHLQARAQAVAAAGGTARGAWLIYGERSSAHDRPCQMDIERWQQAGVLSRVDLAFSRDRIDTPYVQHLLRRHAAEVRTWIDDDADILICGGRAMAADVEKALRELLGDARLEALLESGRIRRDVF